MCRQAEYRLTFSSCPQNEVTDWEFQQITNAMKTLMCVFERIMLLAVTVSARAISQLCSWLPIPQDNLFSVSHVH